MMILMMTWNDKPLAPALQSPWFAPHVMVYMVAYALLGAAALMALYMLIARPGEGARRSSMAVADTLVRIGVAFMTVGMLFGALWAKEAWGHYWSWDPKETWAATTWFSYLLYMRYRRWPHHKPCVALWGLIIAFLLLQMCWWGINYLPSAQGTSIHPY